MSDSRTTTLALLDTLEGKDVSVGLKEMADRLVARAKSEVKTMDGWSNEWYWHEINPHVTEDYAAVITALRGLTGADYENRARSSLVRQLTEADSIAQAFANTSMHPAVSELATNIVNENREALSALSNASTTQQK